MQRRYPLLILLFSLSGLTGLIYESIWTHYLKLFLGHAAYAQTLVLAIFMGGMALGSFLSSRYMGRWRNLFLGYALAEGAIGISALLFHDVFEKAVGFSFHTALPALGSPAAVNAYKWILSSLLILPQTVLLGMTFPLMSGAVLRRFPEDPGRSISLLYFSNSIGAAIGVIASGFWLVRLLGLPGTIRFAGVLNILIAAVIWYLSVRGGYVAAPVHVEKTAGEGGSRGWYLALLTVSLVTGTSSFIYEVGWIRMLSLVLGSSTHAFELMLSSFILGLALGGLWIHGRIDRVAQPVRYLLFIQVIMGALALLTLPVYGNTFEVMQWLMKHVAKTDTGYALFNLSSHAIASAIMLPAAFCAGMTLPLITFILLRRGYGERSIGAVYAANTVGAIAGVFFAIHAGLPLLGLKGLLIFGAGLDILLGLALLWSPAAGYTGRKIPAAVTAFSMIAVVCVLLLVELDPYKMASGVYREVGAITKDDSRLVFHRDGKTATVSMVLQNSGVMQIRTNGKIDASINIAPNGIGHADEATMLLASALPLSINPEAKTAANIGFGSGLTTRALLAAPSIEQVDTIEIENAMVAAARNFGSFVEPAYTDPRSRIFIDDAKTFFSAHQKKYDIIISEPSNPWVSGVAGLFSDEFYGMINRYLNDRGLLVQWVQLYEIDLPLVVSVLKSVSANFADFVIYASDVGDMLIIASNYDLPDPGSHIFEYPELSQLLRRVNIVGMQDIMIRKLGDKKILGPFIETFSIKANSDYYPVLDQNAAKTRFLKARAQEFVTFAHEPLPLVEMLAGKPRLFGETSVSATPFFPKTQAVEKAVMLRNILLKKSGTPDIPEDIIRQAHGIRTVFYECGSMSADKRIPVIFNGALSLVPYLSAEELDGIWHMLEEGPCTKNMSGTEKKWISLFKSLGHRDAEAIAARAADILDAGEEKTASESKYLLAAQMLGHVVHGEGGKAMNAWQTHQGTVVGKSSPGILFRLLRAYSASRERAGK